MLMSAIGLSRHDGAYQRILCLHKGGTGILKISKALGIGTGTVQRIVMESRALSTSAQAREGQVRGYDRDAIRT